MKYVQLAHLRDLVMLVASSHTTRVIQHMKNGGYHVYFLVAGSLTEMFLYMVKEVEAIKGGFITYNQYTGEIGSSEKPINEPSIESFPVVEIINQDLLPEELLEKMDRL
ncbi:MAG: hypothetical protein ACLFVP_01450 [Candidatus Bathyarchaeia archaeon]